MTNFGHSRILSSVGEGGCARALRVLNGAEAAAPRRRLALLPVEFESRPSQIRAVHPSPRNPSQTESNRPVSVVVLSLCLSDIAANLPLAKNCGGLDPVLFDLSPAIDGGLRSVGAARCVARALCALATRRRNSRLSEVHRSALRPPEQHIYANSSWQPAAPVKTAPHCWARSKPVL